MGNLLTDSSTVELSLWPDTVYHVQVTCKHKVSLFQHNTTNISTFLNDTSQLDRALHRLTIYILLSYFFSLLSSDVNYAPHQVVLLSKKMQYGCFVLVVPQSSVTKISLLQKDCAKCQRIISIHTFIHSNTHIFIKTKTKNSCSSIKDIMDVAIKPSLRSIFLRDAIVSYERIFSFLINKGGGILWVPLMVGGGRRWYVNASAAEHFVNC